ncbi:unnamed protein product [Oppiella nova]|uniref:Protein kinase domain-containing protein n=1 Tax=Oppiella nova TaxID=334625 RepID=A0A7R9LJJ3_9ACAR|nr:unnamed protein product [Oppiella nova]CAG2164263.1 unnamed protein product [Oppiella nova]
MISTQSNLSDTLSINNVSLTEFLDATGLDRDIPDNTPWPYTFDNDLQVKKATILRSLPQPIATSSTSISYKQTFVEISLQGKGGFGRVYKVEHKLTGQISAIKQIQLKDSEENANTLKEVEILVKVKSQYVVECYQSWREPGFLFIQMEFCSQNLKDILKDKPQLCGFDLATVHDKRIHDMSTQKHTPDVGDMRYQAPENIQGELFDVEVHTIDDNRSLAYSSNNMQYLAQIQENENRNKILVKEIRCELKEQGRLTQFLNDTGLHREAIGMAEIFHMEQPWPYTHGMDLKVINAKILRSGNSRYFSMDSSPRGRAIVFLTVDGLKEEVDRWKSIFEQLDFRCDVYEKATCSQIRDVLSGVSCQRFDTDALLVMFIGGGYDEKIRGFCRKPQQIENISLNGHNRTYLINAHSNCTENNMFATYIGAW